MSQDFGLPRVLPEALLEEIEEELFSLRAWEPGEVKVLPAFQEANLGGRRHDVHNKWLGRMPHRLTIEA